MTMSVKGMVKQNNEKRKMLTPENKAYFENLLVAIRTNAFKSEHATEEVLMELLDHLLQAQKEGKSAEAVFGKTPKLLAEDIIESLPAESKKINLSFGAEILLTLFGWAIVPWGIFVFFKGEEQTIYIGSALLYAVLLVSGLLGLIRLIFKMVRQDAIGPSRNKIKSSLLFGISFGLLITVLVFINVLVKPFGPTVSMNYYTIFGLGCFFLLAAYLFRKMRESN